MVVGTIIGAAIFVQPSEVTGQVPTMLGVFAVWLAAGVLTIVPGALVIYFVRNYIAKGFALGRV